MKKTVRILAAILATLAIFALPSCSNTKTEIRRLTTKIDERIRAYDSFEVAITTDIKYFEDGVAVYSHAEGHEILTGLVSGDFQMYTKLETEVSSEKLKEEQKVTQTEGYYEGNYFLTTKGDYFNQRIYSPLTTEEAYEFVVGNDIGFGSYYNCQKALVSTKDDGTTQLHLSGYSKQTLDAICDHFGVDVSVFAVPVTDVNVRITVDESYLVKELRLDFVFEKARVEKYTPSVHIVTEYGNFDEALIYPGMGRITQHTEVYDIRMLKAINRMFVNLYNSPHDEFDISFYEKESAMGKTTVSEGSSRVIYGEDKDGYYFTVEDKDSKYITQYKNGRQSELDPEGSVLDTTSVPEAEARSYINSLINSGGFSIPAVTDIQKISDGVYEIKCANNLIYKKVNNGWQLDGVKQTITVTVVNDKIVKIVSEVRISGRYIHAQHQFEATKTIDTTIDFQPNKNDSNYLGVDSYGWLS